MRKLLLNPLYLFTGFICSQPVAIAKLAWESVAFEAILPAGEEKTSTTFNFKNDGAESVRINSVRSTCGCTVGTADKQDYGPGESGKLHVQFDAKGAVGRQDKIITVETRNGVGQVESYSLSVKITVTELLTISPRLLIWRKGDAPTARKVNLEVATKTGAEVMAASSDSLALDVLLSRESPTKWVLAVKPVSTDEDSRSVITITLTKHDQTKMLRTVYVRVQ